MADLTDVGDALVALAAKVLYPNGTGQPSVAGIGVRVFQGWPNSQQLDADLQVGIANVSVYPRPEERNTTRYSKDWKQQAINATTLTLTINGQQITVGGIVPTADNPQNVAVVADDQSFTYAATSADTLTGIATALATLISARIIGTSNTGTTITLPSSTRISAARVGGTGTMIRELRRQERLFQISIWANTPDHRNAVVQPIDVALADTPRLTLIDGMSARLIYKSSPANDGNQKDRLYRRDLFYTVEYATTQATTATQIVTEQINIEPQNISGAHVATVQINL